uniref:ribonuclease Z n=1 Tax=Rhizophagus irregularis (strain DAOM 181602 / DAOM 197198 / MUCL 43194) TaxID=747089 RepID=U9STY1_RHIID
MFNQGQLFNDLKSSNKKRSKYDEDIGTAMNISDQPQDNQTTQTSKKSNSGKSSPNRGDNKDSLRKFDPLAAKALELEPGPQYADLMRGNSVTAPDGTVIHPHQVMDPSRPGMTFIILDVPSTSYISSVCESPEFVTYQISNKDTQPRVIIHMVGNGVLEDKRYQEWMNKFGPETEPIIANEKYCPQRIIFYSSALMDNIPKKASFAVPMMIYQTEPSFKLDMSQLGPVFDHNIESGKLLESSDDYLNIAEEVKQEVARSHSEAKNIPGKDVIITTLGTGSRSIEMQLFIYLTNFLRLVSATLIKIPNNGFILLDVGEGTLGSMSRHFGPYDQPHGDDQTSLESRISNLKCIFISHMHADHHLGIVRVLKKWNEVNG